MTSRQASIVRILMQTAPQPVTVKAVAQKLGISSRTILRELPSIEGWMKENGFDFVRKPSVGLAIVEEPEAIRRIESLLEEGHVQKGYSRKERRRQILCELLCTRGPVKSYLFLSRFHISEGTLAGDLDALSEWFAAYRMEIVRRPGVGIALKGSETAYRQAIASAAFEFVDEGRLLELLRSAGDLEASASRGTDVPERLLRFIDPQVVAFVEQIFMETEKKLDIHYTDSGFMALIVHLSLSIKRLQSGERIELEPEELQRLSKLPEHPLAEEMAKSIEKKFHIEVPEEEVGFITMHLASARIWPQTRKGRSQIQTINTRQVAMAIVESVEQRTGLAFHTCSRMIEELTSHMDSMLSRLSMNIHLENGQVDMVRRNYPEIYGAVEQACSIFKKMLMIDDIQPSEVAFVAMHFAAASEELQNKQKQVAAAVVCPSGMGASRVLAANLTRSFPNIEVRQILSAFGIEPEGLRKAGIDLVISTVPLQMDFPVVCVSPVPQAQDTLLIMRAVEAVGKKRMGQREEKPSVKQLPALLTLEGIASLTRMGEEILQILEHFVVVSLEGVYTAESFLGRAAGLFADSMLDRQVIGEDLARREAVNTTFLPEMGIYLMHCRTRAVEHCRFGYLRLEQPFEVLKGTVKGAVVLLAPKDGRQECVETVSRISMLLAEDEGFLQALGRGDEKEGRSLAEQALVKYYENKIRTRIGDEKT